MPVIRSNLSLGIDALEQFACRLVCRVLRDEFAVNGEVEDFGLGLLIFSCNFSLLFPILSTNDNKCSTLSTIRFCSCKGGNGTQNSFIAFRGTFFIVLPVADLNAYFRK